MTVKADDLAVRRVLRALEEHGLLPRVDASLPSVVTIVAGEPVRGSWWAHPASHEIYRVCGELEERRDVIIAKLISGKDTYVHRRLCPALAAVGAARERWKLDGLSPAAGRLLDAVTASGSLRTDEVPRGGDSKKEPPGEAARELERRLLVYAEEVHTESGAHAKRLETWPRWARRARVSTRGMTAAQGRRELEEAVAALNGRYGGNGRLPWQ